PVCQWASRALRNRTTSPAGADRLPGPMNAPENEAEWAAWYQQAWDVRDDQLYRERFPTMTGEIGTLGGSDALEAWLSSDLAQVSEIDPAWKSSGVRVAPPDETRPVWTYVTSGLSNPFTVGPGDAFDPEGPSGIGYELVIHTPEEARWPILRLLDMMAYKDRKSTRLNSSHVKISYAVFCSKKKHTQFTQ